MAVKIRLARRGRKKKPFYHIVVSDVRSPRDGRFIEKLGSYNPMTKPATIELDKDKAVDWLMKGAQPTDTARAILRFKGVMYRKHLLRGVLKGALTQEQADDLYQKHVEAKEEKVKERFVQTEKEMEAWRKKVDGSPKAVVKEVESDQESLAQFQEEPAVEEVPEGEDAAAEVQEQDQVKEEEGAPVEEEVEDETTPAVEASGEEE